MAIAESANCSLLHRVQDLLRRKPNSYDMVFYVGPVEKEVKAVRILLAAASPVLEKEFDLWENSVVREGSGKKFLLPDFDPEAFEVFVKLTMLDEWTVQALEDFKMQPGRILNLISICRHYKMKRALRNLKHVLKSFYSNFATFKNTPEFLGLCQAHLQTILSSKNLPIPEVDVFDCACRWAKAECARRQIEDTANNLRLVLGDCVFQIRFPLMTAKEFTRCVNQYDILTPAEGYTVLKYISNDGIQNSVVDASQFPFNIKSRVMLIQSKTKIDVNSFQELGGIDFRDNMTTGIQSLQAKSHPTGAKESSRVDFGSLFKTRGKILPANTSTAHGCDDDMVACPVCTLFNPKHRVVCDCCQHRIKPIRE